MKEKKDHISEKSARTYFVMTFCTAILLFFYMELSGRTGEAPGAAPAAARPQKEWTVLGERLPQPESKPRTDVRAVPAYPWDEKDASLQIDLQAARDALRGEPPADRAAGEEARKLLDSRIILPPGKVLLWQLRKHVGEQAQVKVVADADAWNRHPWITSSGKEVKLEQALQQLENRSGVRHVVMKDHAGEVALFLVGPQTSD